MVVEPGLRVRPLLRGDTDPASGPGAEPPAETVEAEVACFSYFAGASHFHRAMVGPQVVPLFCPPETATRADAIDVFVAWARANENDEALMGELPVEGVMRAIIAEYPCP